MLEARGWIIHRVWSTDWFQRPDEQTKRILDTLNKARLHWDEIDKADAEAATILSARIKKTEIDLDSFWTRNEASQDDDNVADSSDYVESQFNVRGFDGQVAGLRDDQLASILKRIVEKEAPIHAEELGRRCIAILGSGRMTASFKNRIGMAIQLLHSREFAERKGDFVYRLNQHEIKWRNRKNSSSANLRKIEFIADEEFKAAILAVVRESIGPDSLEIASSVGRKLGITNSSSLQTKLEQLVSELQTNSLISERVGKLFAV